MIRRLEKEFESVKDESKEVSASSSKSSSHGSY